MGVKQTMTEEAPGWPKEGKKWPKGWIIGLIIGVLVVGCFALVYISLTTPNRLPVASFTYSPSSPSMADVIQFTDTSSDEDGQVVSWSWNFGDGIISTLQNPTHQYSAAGTYTVTLMVTDDKGETGEYSRVVIVSQIEVMFQNFELGNGTSDAYFYDAWRSSSSFESSTVHRGTRSVKMIVPAPDVENTGATIGINAASPSSYLDMSSATTFSVWVYDTQGNNTVELKLKDSDGTVGPGLWSDMSSTQNTWTKISWDISSYSGVDKSRIASIELYEWNQGTYYFDDVSFS